MNNFLSYNEYEILSIMWKVGGPVTRADILERTKNRDWNPASIHLILNSMISKGAIKITDAKVRYRRTYEPAISYDEYIIWLIKTSIPDKSFIDVLNDCSRIAKKCGKKGRL